MSTRNLLLCRRVFGILQQLNGLPVIKTHDLEIIAKHGMTSSKRFMLGILLGGMTVFLAACKDQITDPNTNPIVFPASNVSFSQHVQPLFTQRCAFVGCHAGSNPMAGLDLSSPAYNALLNHQPRLFTVGASGNSLLIERLDGRIAPQMPFNSQPLNTNQLAGMKKWIDEGAKNN